MVVEVYSLAYEFSEGSPTSAPFFTQMTGIWGHSRESSISFASDSLKNKSSPSSSQSVPDCAPRKPSCHSHLEEGVRDCRVRDSPEHQDESLDPPPPPPPPPPWPTPSNTWACSTNAGCAEGVFEKAAELYKPSMEIKESEQSLVCGRPRVDTSPVGTCLACEGPHLSHMPPEMHWWRRSEGGTLQRLKNSFYLKAIRLLNSHH
ncbi:uncharacterized protein ACWYII_003424 isoform 1-T1 [Salvelinus alpinus]